jgi:hypothetical protein
MSTSAETDTLTTETPSTSTAVVPVASEEATDSPIPLWPEGVLAVVAGVTLVVIGLRHRVWIQRKVRDAQRVVDEFQRQGGVDELVQVARQATDLIKGGSR